MTGDIVKIGHKIEGLNSESCHNKVSKHRANKEGPVRGPQTDLQRVRNTSYRKKHNLQDYQ